MLLLHDNARPHVAKQTVKKLADYKCEILLHPPYSPDLSPTDYHLFKHLDTFVK
ncbi:Histone-lysine N-methyltransferase SETMAR [Ooceraea biroi]|uniref:Histone-lysine N-methyltransferase SETMAR n=1 Tax=Ooceraea biroi TaxID=2015173 RepID=A0A026W044_OOCBI|nr:Histone-lysine N-methyltransferase SETMAR [Ooceraea biroi]